MPGRSRKTNPAERFAYASKEDIEVVKTEDIEDDEQVTVKEEEKES